MLDFILKNAKAVAVFVVGVIINAVYDVLEGRAPFPTSLGEAARYLLTALLLALSAYLPRNKQTKPQVETAVEKDLNDAETVAVAKTALDTLPEGTRNNIRDYLRETT